MKVVLVGMPGSGKSTVGRSLAHRMQLPFSDSDAVIEQRLGCAIRDYFEREGEAAFRDVEQAVIDELTQGVIRDESRAAYQRVIDRLAGGGAQAVVLACTEIGLLLAPGQSALPMIDSAEAHAAELARVALAVPA